MLIGKRIKKLVLAGAFFCAIPGLAIAQAVPGGPVSAPQQPSDSGGIGVNLDLGQLVGLFGGKQKKMLMRDDKSQDYTDDSIIFIFAGNVESARIFAAEKGLLDIDAYELESIDSVMVAARIPNGQTAEDMLLILTVSPQVLQAQREGIFEQMGHISGPLIRSKPPLHIAAANTSNFGTVRIAMIDGLVDIHHETLAAGWIKQSNFTDTNQDSPHGTAIASLIIGRGEVVGSAANQQLYSFAAFSPSPGNDPGLTRTRELAKALDGAAKINPNIVNMSFGGPEDALLARILSSMAKRGSCMVAATGNGGKKGKPPFPATLNSITGITAVDSKLKSYKYATPGRHVTAAAKGVKRLTAVPGGYRIASGTSFATADVAGQLAGLGLCSSQRKGSSLNSHIAGSARDLGQPGRDDYYGYGLFQN